MHPFPKSIFVTGIGTGVGKTVVSATLVEALNADYWKPIQCGNLNESDALTVKSLISDSISQIHPEAYRFKTSSSPHYAAKMEEVEIDLANCIRPLTENRLIIEGAGGLMVPLNDDEYVADLIIAFDVPVVLVCRNYLGSINHTLLSIEMMKHKGIRLLGLIFSGDNFLDNEEIIQQFGKTTMLGRIDEASVIDKRFIQHQAQRLKTSISKYYSLE
jgi:dethiobiotin synthetase